MPLPHTKLDVQNNATLQKYTNPPTYLSQQETEYDYPHTSFSGPKPHHTLEWSFPTNICSTMFPLCLKGF